MESAYRLVHSLSPEFIRTFNWSSFVPGLESCDLAVKWQVHICSLQFVVSTFHSSLIVMYTYAPFESPFKSKQCLPLIDLGLHSGLNIILNIVVCQSVVTFSCDFKL